MSTFISNFILHGRAKRGPMSACNIIPQDIRFRLVGLQYFPFRYLGITEKMNKSGRVQLRGLLITGEVIYSFDPGDGRIKRSVAMSRLRRVHVCVSRLEVALTFSPSDSDPQHDLVVRTRSHQALLALLNGIPPSVPREEWMQSLFSAPVIREAKLCLEKQKGFSSAVKGVKWQVSELRSVSGAPSPTAAVNGTSIEAEAKPQSEEGNVDCLPSSGDEAYDAMDDIDFSAVHSPQRSTLSVQPERMTVDQRVNDVMGNPPLAPAVMVPSGWLIHTEEHLPAFFDSNDFTPLPKATSFVEYAAIVEMSSNPHVRELRMRVRDFERRLEEQQRTAAQLLAAQRDNCSVLRRIIADLRLEVERLSLENILLRRPLPPM
jgi:hypothetical protein